MVRKLSLIMIVLLFLGLFEGCKYKDEQHELSLEDQMKAFTKALSRKDLNEMSLEIYYTNPDILTYAPYSVDDLTRIGHKVSISNAVLLDNI